MFIQFPISSEKESVAMPIFDYSCDHCGAVFEILLLRGTERIQCPKCGGDSVKRSAISTFSCTGVQLTKRLKMESEEQLKKGQKMMRRENLRKKRIGIL
jgi:putative FmdB family regulatory protein